MSVEARKTKAGKSRYIARIKAGGQLVASRSFDRKNDALAWEREQLRLITTGHPLPPKKSFTLAELVKRFQQSRKDGNPHTNDTDNNNLAALPKSLLMRPLSAVQASDIREHLIAELASGKAPSTVARAKTTLSALFTYADDHGLLHQPHPVRSMRKVPELGEVALRSINPGEIPTAGRIDKVSIRSSEHHRIFRLSTIGYCGSAPVDIAGERHLGRRDAHRPGFSRPRRCVRAC